METIEIRQNKKTSLFILAVVIGAQLVMGYFIFFTNNGNTLIKVVYGIMTPIMFYGFYFPIKRLIDNAPVLIISRSEITINKKNKPVTFPWIQIREWRIEQDSDGTNHYLILETTEGKKKVDISWLELDPDEIEELINEYKNAGRESASSNKAQ